MFKDVHCGFIIAKIRNNCSIQKRGKRNFGKSMDWKYCISILDVLEEF